MRGLLSCLILAIGTSAAADSYTVTLDPSLQQGTAPGRLLLFFITEQGRRWDSRQPAEGPFFQSPQPIASIAVGALAPGESVTIKDPNASFPGSLAELDGVIRVQAVLDLDTTERSHLEGPGNFLSEVVKTTVLADGEDHVKLTLSRRVEPRKQPAPVEGIEWVVHGSDELSAFYGRHVDHLAAVVLPRGYSDPANADRRWPTIYVIPGFGGRCYEASWFAHRLRQSSAPQAVWVFLDPESPLGHHGFVDSSNHGARATALIDELIPELEKRFRIDSRSAARILTGHSSGAWSALWLQLNHPEVFGACWASAPDPIDFRAFQCSNLYEDQNLFRSIDGTPQPSMRRRGDDGDEVVTMTVEQECLMEHAMAPQGRSGQQWDAWEAMFSPHDVAAGAPRPMFDAQTGSIDAEVVEHWSAYDIGRLVTGDWDRYGPVLMQRVRLACGTADSFYLDRAVELFKADAEALAGKWEGPGYIMLVDGATHGSVVHRMRRRWDQEMGDYLKGLP
jgi:hypothetical protein